MLALISASLNLDSYLNHFDYIEKIDRIPITRERQLQKDSVCTKTESSQYCKLVGQLNWAAAHTHPDIAFDISVLSSTMKTPTVSNVLKANKVLQRIKGNPLKFS